LSKNGELGFSPPRLINKWLLMKDILIMNQLVNMGNSCLEKDEWWSFIPPIQLHFQVMFVAVPCHLEVWDSKMWDKRMFEDFSRDI
jgi:hypothetical protein